jgi:hypothetical protein
MTRDDDSRQVRTTALVRTAWGTVLVLMPERLLRAGVGRPVPAAAVTAVRVLGVRHLLQAGVAAALPTRPVAGLGALVDIAHASSCIGVAAGSPRWRSAALTDFLVEVAFAAAGWGVGRRSGPGRTDRRGTLWLHGPGRTGRHANGRAVSRLLRIGR